MHIVKQMARVAMMLGLCVIALAASVAIGALAVSPNEELRIVALTIGALCVTASIIYVLRTSHRPTAASRGLGITPRGAVSRGVRPRDATLPAPRAVSSHGTRAIRTPKAVEALAMAGTAPAEISWRTGLPVDAVAMLLALSNGSRPLSPGMS